MTTQTHDRDEDDPPPCARCGDDGAGTAFGEVLCAAHLISDHERSLAERDEDR